MQISATSKLITTIIFLLSIVTLSASLYAANSLMQRKAASDARYKTMTAINKFANASDNLTSLIRAYAATSENSYIREYHTDVDITQSREKAVELLQNLNVPSDEMEQINIAKFNSDELTALEIKSAEAAQFGNNKQAIALVYSTEYKIAKDKIMTPITNTRIHMEKRFTDEIEKLTLHAENASRISWIASATTFFIVFISLIFFYQRLIVTPLLHFISDTQRLLAGEKNIRFGYGNNKSEISELAKLFDAYRLKTEEIEQQQWIRSTITDMSTSLYTADSISLFGNSLLSYLATIIPFGAAVFYIKQEEEHSYNLSATYGAKHDSLPAQFLPGEGIIGQAALSQSTIVLSNVPENYLRIESALGISKSTNSLVLPVVSHGECLAVLEFVFFNKIPSEQKLLLNELTPLIALHLEILRRNLRTQELLSKTQRQTEELSVSACQLKSRREELETLNFHLAEQTKCLEQQKNALEEAEEQSRLILSSVDNGILGLDSAGKIIFANPASVQMLGYTVEELQYQNLHELVHYAYPDGSHYPEESCPIFMTVHDTQRRSINNEVIWHKDGHSFPVEYSISPIIHNEITSGFVIIFQDITQQKLNEKLIRESEQRMQQLLENSPAGVVFIIEQEILTFANHSFIEMLDLRSDTILTHNFSDFWKEKADYIRFNQIIAQASSVDDYEACFVKTDGSSLWVLLNARWQEQETERVLLLWVYDINAMKKAQTTLANQYAFQKALIETIPYPVFYKSPDTRIIGINRAYEEAYAVTRQDVIGKKVTELSFLPEQDRLLYQAEDEAVIKEASTIRRYVPIPYADGKQHETIYFVSGFQNDDGTPGGLVGTFIDITEQKEAELALAKAKNIAEDATKMKSDFLANMSHEIRTPMNAIIGISHLVLKSDLNRKQQDYVHKIQQSGQHLLGIINDILDFSKIEAGKLSIENTDFELSKVLDNVTNLINEKASSKGLELIINIKPDVPNILVGDPLRIGQILINYANNAVKFTQKGEICISVNKDSETKEHVVLRFNVSDTGIGLSEQHIKKLFQAFQQADSSTTRNYGGTGLGLAISKNLAELMQGQTGVESKLGQGSNFWFTAKLRKSQKQKNRLLPAQKLQGCRMLVVDDNEHSRLVIADMLTLMTFHVDTAISGAEAIKLILSADATTPYEVVFLDWQMPEMNGNETALQIKSLHLMHPPKLLMLTAYGREEVLQAARSAGIEDILIKPVTPSLLFDTLMTTLDQSGDNNQNITTYPAVKTEQITPFIGFRILLVEDNELNREVATELLHMAGFIVDTAENGKVALEMVSRANYDLVLMDMQMPVMDGVTATREIRKLPQFSTLPIVAMTANVMQHDKDKCIAAGMNDHIAKPIDPDELWEKMHYWLKLKSITTATANKPSTSAQSVTETQLSTDIPGLDTRIGLQRMAGNDKLYLSMLNKFIHSQCASSELIFKALKANDTPTAELIAHTLKSTAGNIGATKIQDIAIQLESAISSHEPEQNIDLMLNELSAELSALTHSLSFFLPSENSSDPAGLPIVREKTQQILIQLVNLLSDDDPEAVELYSEFSALFHQLLGDKHVDIEQKISNFDYEDALLILNPLLSNMHDAV